MSKIIHLLKNNKIYLKKGSRCDYSKTKCNRLFNSVTRFDRLTLDEKEVTCCNCLSDNKSTKEVSMPDVILDVLKNTPGLMQHEIVEKCGRTSKSRSTVCSAMWRLKANDEIAQKGGLYYVGGSR